MQEAPESQGRREEALGSGKVDTELGVVSILSLHPTE